jgi:hypothetical protein
MSSTPAALLWRELPLHRDPGAPADYAPFGIQALLTAGGATQIHVAAHSSRRRTMTTIDGPGLGIVDVHDTNGT